MGATYQIRVFGKRACGKTRALNRRAEKLIRQGPFSDFDLCFMDIETVDGLAAFSAAGCIRPSRIPALLVLKKEKNRYAPVPANGSLSKSRLYSFLGLQTDYSALGKGIISPAMIRLVLTEAQA